MTMATGIISFGFAVAGRLLISRVLLAITAISFVALCVLTAWRFLAWRSDFVEDFTHPLRGFGFYSFVAAANVLAVRVADDLRSVALTLLVVSAAAWLVRGYVVPWTTHLDRGERPIVKAANGTWFMWAVAGQSVGLAASTLSATHGGELLPFVAVCGWALGLFLYVVDGVFVVMRLLSYEFSAEDLTPPYWIAMGAAAISSLAGVHLATLDADPFVDTVRELARGSGLALWVVASWLVPGLFAMGWWRHVTHRVPLRYDASMWSIIFPLGMYATTSLTLAGLEHLPGLDVVGHVGLWVALAAWLLAAGGLVPHVWTDVLSPRGRPEAA
jgi:tellurite resistance protein TehA-like permease